MRHFGGIILAGGESSRMGKNKADLEIRGRTLLEQLLENLTPVVSEIVIMLANGQNVSFLPGDIGEHVRFGHDSKPLKGPLQGIADALQFISSHIDSVFLLACDLPYLTTEWLIKMREAFMPGVDIVCSNDKNITNPLLALYRKTVLLRAPEMLEQGHTSPRDLLKGKRIVRLVSPQSDPFVCMDINTPTDYKKAMKHFNKPACLVGHNEV